MYPIQSSDKYHISAQVRQLHSRNNYLPSVSRIDVYEPENLGLVISGPLHGHDFDTIRAAYEQKLRLSDHPYLYLELHDLNRTTAQQSWDELTQELKLMGDFYRIAIVRPAAAPVNTGEYAAPGVIIQQFNLAEAEAAKCWLI